MLSRTGGLLTNGRTDKKPSDLPQVQPMRPQQPTQPAAQPQQPQQPQPAPQQAAQPVGQPQQAPPTPGGQTASEGVNTMANNALALLHDEQAAPQFEQMIAQGEEGAASAAVLIGQQVVEADRAHGVEPNMENASDAIMEVVGDIVEMGIAQGSMPSEPVINDVPAAVYATLAYASDKWAQIFPEFGQDLASEVKQATQQDDAAARQVAAYMKQRQLEQGNANKSQSTPEPGNGAIDTTGGRVATAPQQL